MASKLYFYYGPMGSSKTLRLLSTAYDFEEKDIQIMVLKPSLDTRDGKDILKPFCRVLVLSYCLEEPVYVLQGSKVVLIKACKGRSRIVIQQQPIESCHGYSFLLLFQT